MVNFVQYEMFEDRIVNRLRNIAMAFHPLKVELKDFGSFPTHSIFINVTTKLPVQELTKKIRSEAQRQMKLDADNKPHFMLEPHITVAAKLTPAQYEAAWKEEIARLAAAVATCPHRGRQIDAGKPCCATHICTRDTRVVGRADCVACQDAALSPPAITSP